MNSYAHETSSEAKETESIQDQGDAFLINSKQAKSSTKKKTSSQKARIPKDLQEVKDSSRTTTTVASDNEGTPASQENSVQNEARNLRPETS